MKTAPVQTDGYHGYMIRLFDLDGAELRPQLHLIGWYFNIILSVSHNENENLVLTYGFSHSRP